MSATAANFQPNGKVPVVDRKTRWIVVQVADDQTLFVEPGTLRLDQGWVGDIVWYVFTKGYTLPEENAIVFHPNLSEAPPFNGAPTPDPSRPGCWSTPASNNNDTPILASFSYTITVTKADDASFSIYGDPVIENEPVP